MHEQPQSADMLPGSEQVGQWTIPPISVYTMMLLERIHSPFMRFQPKPVDGEPPPPPIIPSLTEIAEALYIIVNQDDPRLETILGDPIIFSRCVGEMARKLTMREMAAVTARLNRMMFQINKAVDETGGGADGKKGGTGPSPSLTPSSPSTVAEQAPQQSVTPAASPS